MWLRPVRKRAETIAVAWDLSTCLALHKQILLVGRTSRSRQYFTEDSALGAWERVGGQELIRIVQVFPSNLLEEARVAASLAVAGVDQRADIGPPDVDLRPLRERLERAEQLEE